MSMASSVADCVMIVIDSVTAPPASCNQVKCTARDDLLAPILDSLHGVISDVRCT